MCLAGLPTDAPPRIEVGLNRDRSPLPPCRSSAHRTASMGVCTLSLADLDSHGAMDRSDVVTAGRENCSRAAGPARPA